MVRNKIEITFNALPAIDFGVSFKYYGNPTVDNTLITVFQVAKTTRAAANQFTIGANTSASATNYAAALAIDYPTLTVVVSTNKVTITSPNSSPIFDHPISNATVSYYTKTGQTFKTNFVFFSNPFENFISPYSIDIPGLASYDLLMRFKTPEIAPNDVAIGSTIALTNANMIPMFNQYFPLSAPAILPYIKFTSTSSQTSYEINYVQRVVSKFITGPTPITDSDITFEIKKNNAVIMTVTKNMSLTLNDANNVLISTLPFTMVSHFVNNLNTFNALPDVQYFMTFDGKLGIQMTGAIQDLWAINVVSNTTGAFTFESTVDLDETSIENNVILPNSVFFSQVLFTKVRGSELLISSNATPFDTTEFKIFAWQGDIFDIPADPYIIITKAKVRVEQTDIFININNYLKTGLKGDVFNFINNSTTYNTAFETSPLETKWAKVEMTNKTNTEITSTSEKYFYAIDGYIDMLDYYTDQNTGILMTGENRYVERGSRQNFFFKTTALAGIIYHVSSDISTDTPIDTNVGTIGTNTNFVLGIAVDTTVADEYIEYDLQYESANYRVRYYLYDACQSEGFQLVFKNRHGMLEGFPITQRVNRSLDVKKTDYLRNIVDVNGLFDVNDHTRKQFNVTGNDGVVFNTDWLPEYMNAPLKELQLTEELWVVDSFGNALPVVKSQDNIAFKTQRNDKLIQYSIALKYSHDTIKLIQ